MGSTASSLIPNSPLSVGLPHPTQRSNWTPIGQVRLELGGVKEGGCGCGSILGKEVAQNALRVVLVSMRNMALSRQKNSFWLHDCLFSTMLGNIRTNILTFIYIGAHVLRILGTIFLLHHGVNYTKKCRLLEVIRISWTVNMILMIM